MADLIQNENNLPTNLEQLTVEIKFYVNQWGQNTIEIGKRLIEAKKLVEHGSWGKWLEDNFNLTQESARKFMKIAERFGNSNTSWNLNSSQMWEMLALPEEETEKFIEAKKAEGNPVDEMTVQNLRDEVKKWKADYEQEKAKTENLFNEKSELQSNYDELQIKFYDNKGLAEKYQAQCDALQEQLDNQKPIEKIVEKTPADYEPTKKRNSELENELAELKTKITELENKPIDVAIEKPADYEKNKKELEELKEKYENFSQVAVIIQTLESISQQINGIIHLPQLGNALNYFEKTNPVEANKLDARVGDFLKVMRS